MPGLTITKADPSTDGETVLVVGGEIDLSTDPEFRAALDEALDARPSGLAVDLSAVEFLSSGGLSTMVGVHKRAEDLGIPLSWVDPPMAVMRVLVLTDLDQILTVRMSDSG